jgi:hypothetical protein
VNGPLSGAQPVSKVAGPRRLTMPLMGRNARRRAEQKAAEHPAGNSGESPEGVDRLERCPRCGAGGLVESEQGGWPGAGLTVVCGQCNWQGVYRAGVWG